LRLPNGPVPARVFLPEPAPGRFLRSQEPGRLRSQELIFSEYGRASIAVVASGSFTSLIMPRIVNLFSSMSFHRLSVSSRDFSLHHDPNRPTFFTWAFFPRRGIPPNVSTREINRRFGKPRPIALALSILPGRRFVAQPLVFPAPLCSALVFAAQGPPAWSPPLTRCFSPCACFLLDALSTPFPCRSGPCVRSSDNPEMFFRTALVSFSDSTDTAER